MPTSARGLGGFAGKFSLPSERVPSPLPPNTKILGEECIGLPGRRFPFVSAAPLIHWRASADSYLFVCLNDFLHSMHLTQSDIGVHIGRGHSRRDCLGTWLLRQKPKVVFHVLAVSDVCNF